jgi:hypothetical protein
MFRTTPPASMISLHAWVSRARARPPGAVFAASNAALMLAELEAAPGAAVREMQRVARRAPGSADMRAALAALYWAQARRRPPPKPVPSSACARRCRRQAQSEGAGACRDLSASRAPASAHSRGRAGVCVERAACACAECRRCVFDTVQAKSLQVCAGHSQRLCMQLCSEWHSHQHTRPRQGNEAAAEGEWNTACDRITVGCARYQDADWLRRIRRRGAWLAWDCAWAHPGLLQTGRRCTPTAARRPHAAPQHALSHARFHVMAHDVANLDGHHPGLQA